MILNCWAILDINPTRDQREIKRAYAKKLKTCRPDDDPAGFQRLVEARDIALNLAASPNWPPATPEEEAAPDNHRIEGDAPASDALDGNKLKAELHLDMPPEGDEQILMSELLRSLDELIETRKDWIETNRLVWKAACWTALFNRAIPVSFERRKIFHGEIASRLQTFLPAAVARDSDQYEEFQNGEGVAAIVEVIEEECNFLWLESDFRQKAGDIGTRNYFFWLTVANSARKVTERRQVGRQAYSDPQTRLPIFMKDDLAALLDDKATAKFVERSFQNRKWSRSFSWISLLFPASHFFGAGIQAEAYAILLTTLLVTGAIVLLPNMPLYAEAFLGCLLIAARLYAGTAFFPSKVKSWTRHVGAADRKGLIIPSERHRFLEGRRHGSNLGHVMKAVEVVCIVVLLVQLAFLPGKFVGLQYRDTRADEIIRTHVLKVLETVASKRDTNTEDFLKFLEALDTARETLRAMPEGRSTKIDDIAIPQQFSITLKLAETAKSLRAFGQSDGNLLPGLERGPKLSLIAEQYRAANLEQRESIERTLLQWRAALTAVKDDPSLETAIWALMPPRNLANNILDPAESIKNHLILKFLDNSISAELRGSELHPQLVLNALKELLEIPNKEWLTAIDTSDRKQVLYIPDLSHVPKQALLPLNVALAEKIEAGYLPPAKPGTLNIWSTEAGNWIGLLNSIKTCLRLPLQDSADQSLNRLREKLQDSALSSHLTEPATWAAIGHSLEEIPDCQRAVGVTRLLSGKGQLGGAAISTVYEALRKALMARDFTTARELSVFIDTAEAKNTSGWSAGGGLINFALARERLASHDPFHAIAYLEDPNLASTFTHCQGVWALKGYALEMLNRKEDAISAFETDVMSSQACFPLIDKDLSKVAINNELARLKAQ
ncbi:J domain-containing protein [Allorhizobium taibaishanense]|uniref:J domain-containing protein n=1 Tax=Allorhizobium taibaishanense TaxID=887144 RepID=A0A1Q9A1F8_9HYPH|nr:J domain-containing protein [Allorhizobium taibaishanense]MBB4009336.1 hypothetical protein [Allorhizobium taibaishanense]OLP48408.1 hypothetical protein BJF91_00075 [Allorhizobium taibaishanense]